MKVLQKIVMNIDSCFFRDKTIKFDWSSEWKLLGDRNNKKQWDRHET